MSIQLGAFRDILGCSVGTCDEPVHADVDLKTLKIEANFIN